MPKSFYKQPKRIHFSTKPSIYYKQNSKLYSRLLSDTKDTYVEVLTWNDVFEVYIRPKSKSYGYIVVITDELDKAINVADNLTLSYFNDLICDLVTFY